MVKLKKFAVVLSTAFSFLVHRRRDDKIRTMVA